MTPTAEKTKNGKIVWRVKYLVAKRRVRLTFRTRDEARRWIEEHGDIATTEGQIFWIAWRAITSKERHELMDSLVLIRAHRATHPKSNIVEAVKAQIARENAIRSSISMQEAVDRYLASKLNNKRKGSVSQGWYDVLEPCLHRVARELLDKTLVEFSTDEVEEYLDDQDWSPRTFNNYHAYISSVYKWAIENKVATENPVAKIEKFAKKFLTKEVIVPAVSVINRVLKLARTPKYRHLKSALDLGFGFAMRSSEISKMDWADITKDVVHVPGSVAKGGQPRNIGRRPLLEGVFKSLLAEKKKSGPVAPKGWRRDLTKLFEEAGLGKPRNMVRKASGSYHFHATGDEAKTQEMMGHCEDSSIFGSTYKALKFFDVNNRTPISQSDGIAYYRLWKS